MFGRFGDVELTYIIQTSEHIASFYLLVYFIINFIIMFIMYCYKTCIDGNCTSSNFLN